MPNARRPMSSARRQRRGSKQQPKANVAMMKLSPSELTLLDADSVEREFRSVDTLSQEILEEIAGTTDLDNVRELQLQVRALIEKELD
jgi:hypothetical protein